jgi:hypothetical protein
MNNNSVSNNEAVIAEPLFEAVRSTQFANAEHTLINCEIEHLVYGWIPFTASAGDSEKHGRDLHASLLAGDHGPIADYVPPPPPPADQLATTARAQRDTLLTASDWTQLPDAQARLSPEKKAAWTEYRQALRNVSNQPQFPSEIMWPEKP